jgi:hypothetical protein
LNNEWLRIFENNNLLPSFAFHFNLECRKVVQISNINIECYGDFIRGTTIENIIS